MLRFPSELIPEREAIVADLLDQFENSHSTLYAIVDRAQVSDSAYWSKVIRRRAETRNLFVGQPEETAVEQAPWLFVLRRDSDQGKSLLTRMVAEAMLRPAIVWISSTLPVDDLAARLAYRMTTFVDGKSTLLRYYDVRLFPTLWNNLTAEDKETFGAFATCWLYLDLQYDLNNLPLHKDPIPDKDPQSSPLSLSEGQIQSLLQESEYYQLMGFLQKRQPDAFLTLPVKARYQHVVKHDHRAQDAGITRFNERLRCCEEALIQSKPT